MVVTGWVFINQLPDELGLEAFPYIVCLQKQFYMICFKYLTKSKGKGEV